MAHDVTILTVDQTRGHPHISYRDGYDIVRYPATAEPLGNAVSVGVANHLRTVDTFDVIHAHSHLYFSTNLAALAAWVHGLPLAITNHGLYSQNAPKQMLDWYLKTLGKWTFNTADVVFCYSETNRDRPDDCGVETDIAVVPNGIDASCFAPDGDASDPVTPSRSSAASGRPRQTHACVSPATVTNETRLSRWLRNWASPTP